MKALILGAVASTALFVGAASAQTVVISPENETVIREYVITNRVEPIPAPTDVQVVVGSTLPDTVELYAIDAPTLETRYSYVVVDGRTVVVEPESRRIIQILE